MKKFRKHLKKNWLKYGIETFAILVGVMGAFTLNNLQDNLGEKQKEKEYTKNLISDLRAQLITIENQIDFETEMRRICEDLIAHIRKEELNIEEFKKMSISLSRKTFVVSNPVFEDLKYSGNLSLLTNTIQRNALLHFYQKTKYTEHVLSRNTELYIDGLSLFLIDENLIDFGEADRILTAQSFDFSLKSESFSESEEIISNGLNNRELRMRLHNKIGARGRTASVHIDLLNQLLKEDQELIDQLLN